MSDEESEFELLMPFVLCQSQGGPHEDKAFVSGWRLGSLDAALKVASIFPEVGDISLAAPPEEEKQIDLIAMKHGFGLLVREFSEDWSIFTFERSAVE